MWCTWRALALGLLLTIGTGAAAFADVLPMVDTSYTANLSGAVSVNRLDVDGPGTLTVTLTDIPWPQSLANVDLLLTSGTGTVLGRSNGFGTETYTIAGAGTLYAFCFGQAAPFKGLDFGFGTYGLRIDFQENPAAVPLPPGGLLLAAGILALALVARAGSWPGVRRDRLTAYRGFPETAIKL
jgi:hypothetical protein